MKCLAFDLGRVVFNFDYNYALSRMKDKVEVPLEDIIDALFYNDFASDFERGLITPYDFYNKFSRAFNAHIDFDNFKNIWNEIFSPNEDVVDFIKRLKIVYKIYLISNINELHFNYLHSKFSDIFSLFDDVILSFKVKAIKPQREIYEELRKKAGVSYEDIVYIDDREDLIREAKKLGLKVIKFNGLVELVAALEEHNIFCPSNREVEALKELKNRINKSKNVLLVGMGNEMRSDDMVGSSLIEDLDNKLTIETINAKDSLENYLGKLRDYNADLIVFFDAASYNEDSRFRTFTVEEIKDGFFLTHDASFQLAAKYLQRTNPSDILIFGIKGYNFFLGDELSRKALQAKHIIKDFFMTHFSKKAGV